MPLDWVFAAAAVLLVIHAVTVLALIRFGNLTATSVGADTKEERVSGDGVLCPDCGVTNQPEYKYCKECVSELPTGVTLTKDSSGGQSHRTF